MKKRASTKKNLSLTIMALPAVIILFLFAYVPMGGLIIAFKDYRFDKGFLGSDWIGFKNFEFFFKSNDAWVVLRNTLGLNFLFIFCTLVISVIIALMLNEVRCRKLVKTTQTIMFFPYFMSWVVVGYLLYAFLHHNFGILNNIITFFGGEAVSWYARADYWPFILTFMYVWKFAGYNSVIYYEAAEIDGASRWQMIWKIALPMIK